MIKIAIASGKGGTGKTFVATNLFCTLLQNNYRAMLVDCDAEAPNAVAFFETKEIEKSEVNQLVPVIDTDKCTFCGKCHEYCNYNAIFILPPMKIINVIEDLCHGCGACSVACIANAISERPVSLGKVETYSVNGLPALIEARMNIGVMSPVPVIKAAIKKIDSLADIAILDAPPGTSCPFIQTVSSADYVILVTEPTPFGFSDLKQSVATLDKINKPYGVIINRAGLGDNVIYNWLKENKIPLLMEIPFDKEIASVYSNGHLLVKKNMKYKTLFNGLLKTIHQLTNFFKMGRKLLFIALILGLCLSIFAQSSSTIKDDSFSPIIVFNKTIHSFGKIIQDAPAGCEFVFYNKGRSPLIISDITASCGCTVPSWSKKPVMPGDSGIIQVLYLTNAPGAFEKEITVFSNATKEPSSLKIKGKVIRK